MKTFKRYLFLWAITTILFSAAHPASAQTVIEKWKGTQGSADWYICDTTKNRPGDKSSINRKWVSEGFWGHWEYDTVYSDDWTKSSRHNDAKIYLYFPSEETTAWLTATGNQDHWEFLLWDGYRSSTFYAYLDDMTNTFDSWLFDGKSNVNYNGNEKDVVFPQQKIQLDFGWNGRNTKAKSVNFKVKLPYHLDINNEVKWNNFKTIRFTPTMKGTADFSDTITFDFNSYMKSYFVEEGITFSIINQDGTPHTAGEFACTTSAIAANTVYADGQACFNDAKKQIGGAYDVSVTYTPNVTNTGSRLAYLVIKKDGEEIKRIALTAEVKDYFTISLVDDELTYNTATYQESLVATEDVNNIKAWWFTANTSGFDSTEISLTNVSLAFEEIANASVTNTAGGTFTARKVGNYGVDVTGSYIYHDVVKDKDTTYTYTLTIPVVVERGTLVFQNNTEDYNWYTADNWFPHNQATNASERIVPNYIDHNAKIIVDCNIATTSGYANCYDLTVESGNLTVAPTGKLYVAGKLTTTTDNLIIQNGSAHPASEPQSIKRLSTNSNDGDVDNEQTGIVVFNNANSDAASANATVELFVPTSTSSSHPVWRYMGVPVKSGSVENVMYIYQWDNSDSHDYGQGNECWIMKGSDAVLDAWTGYSMAKNETTTETTTTSGQLVNVDARVNLPMYQGEGEGLDKQDPRTLHADALHNLVTNSFSAPIQLNKMRLSDFENAEQTIYFYNDGTHDDWEDYATGPGFNGTNDYPGQFTAVPIFVDGSLAEGLRTIPSGKSFFVRSEFVADSIYGESSGSSKPPLEEVNVMPSSLTLRYATVLPTPSEILPAASSKPREPEHFNVLEIRVNGDSLSDRVFLLENANCSEKFDRGYDGSKILGIAGTPQIYATNEFGRAAVNCDQTMTGQYIGFMAGKQGVHYTISFNIDRLEGYESLYLYDTKENKYVDILKGETYRFTGLRSGEEKRFLIVGKRDAEEEENTITERTGDDKKIDIFGNQALVSGFDDESAEIIISDMSGKTLWNSNTDLGPWFNLPDLPSGVYVMSVDKCQTKFVK